MDIGAIAQTQGIEEALSHVKDRIESDPPDLVAIDSIKALHDFVDSDARSRAVLYDLAVNVAGWGVTTLLVGEYVREDFARFPEFAIADGIVHLTNQPHELTSMRQLEVLKLRGTDYVTGRHFFEMSRNGIAFYPRVRVPARPSDGSDPVQQRLTTGVAGSRRAPGRRPARAVHHVRAGRHRRGQDAARPSLPRRRRAARGAGDPVHAGGDARAAARHRRRLRLEPAGAREPGRLTLRYTSPVELSTDGSSTTSGSRWRALGVRRLVLDSLTSTASARHPSADSRSWCTR